MTSPSNSPEVRAVATQLSDLPEVCSFLHENLGRRFTVQEWIASLTQSWAAVSPNFGMHLRCDGRVVGALCAIYSDQVIEGKVVSICNPHSWVVLEPFRSHSLGLLLRLLKQRSYHFTMFTPNPKVAKVFEGLRFRTLDDTMVHFLNVPTLSWLDKRSIVASNKAQIAELLQGADLQDFKQHADIPWLKFLAFGRQGGPLCLVVYKLTRWKRMPCAVLLHISNAQTLAEQGGLLQSHLMLKGGVVWSRVEGRFLNQLPALAIKTKRGQPKLVLSAALQDNQVKDLYSELVALDL